MSKETFYTAVDIGSNKVCSVVARVGAEGDLKILGTGIVTSQGMQKGRIDNIDEVKVAVKSSLEEATIPVCACQHEPTLNLVNRRIIRPSSEEVAGNPRSRSARMRVAERR